MASFLTIFWRRPILMGYELTRYDQGVTDELRDEKDRSSWMEPLIFHSHQITGACTTPHSIPFVGYRKTSWPVWAILVSRMSKTTFST